MAPFVPYVIKEFSAEKVAETCGIGVAEIYRIKHSISAMLKKEIKRLETKIV